MHSIRFKITAISVAVILATVLSVAAVCFFPIRAEADRRSVEIMRLIGQDTRNTLNEYFVSIEQSVDMAANEAIDTLDSVVLVECGAAGTYAAGRERTAAQTARLDGYLAEAVRALGPLPDSKEKSYLAELARFVGSREH